MILLIYYNDVTIISQWTDYRIILVSQLIRLFDFDDLIIIIFDHKTFYRIDIIPFISTEEPETEKRAIKNTIARLAKIDRTIIRK